MNAAPRPRFRHAALVVALLVVPIPARAQSGGGVQEEQPRRKAPPKVVTAAAARAWIKLQEPVTMAFAAETPLGDVVKYIRQATADKESPAGLAFYVDPDALKGSDRTLASTVTLDLEGVPLATSLNLVASQLGLAFGVQKDGVVIIGHRTPATPEVGAAPVTAAEARTWLRLQQVVPIPFDKPAALADLVAFLKGKLGEKDKDAGVPVYLDPVVVGDDGEQRITLAMDAAPLRTALELMLDQVSLTYRVQQDGILVITSPAEAVTYDPPTQRGALAGMGGMGAGMMGGMGGGFGGGMGGMGGGGMGGAMMGSPAQRQGGGVR